jgi:nucleoside-diphosphate-sugar epimerase
MEIIGRGLIAASLAPYAENHEGTIAFAAGVSNSACIDAEAYDRETRLLRETLDRAATLDARIVYFSGAGAIYGRSPSPAVEDGPLEPQTPYGRHQVAAEGVIHDSGVRHLVIRLPNVVGPSGHPHQLVPALVTQVLGGVVRVESRARRDLVGVDAMAAIVDELLTHVTEDTVVHVATGQPVGAEAIVAEIASILGRSPAIDRVDGGRVQSFSTVRLAELLGHQPFPEPDSFRTTLQTYVPALADRLAAGTTSAIERTG